ncbi:MAG: NepR family anti-sigma factor [Pseudomonadota bacterium]
MKKGKPDEIVDAVTQRLQRDYQSLVNEPVPDKFLELLAQLDEGAGQQDPVSDDTPLAGDGERPDASSSNE